MNESCLLTYKCFYLGIRHTQELTFSVKSVLGHFSIRFIQEKRGLAVMFSVLFTLRRGIWTSKSNLGKLSVPNKNHLQFRDKKLNTNFYIN